jgi:hypothetical protein
VLAAGHLPKGFLIALGACLGIGACFLLTAVGIAFRALSPKLYRGIDVAAVRARTTPNALNRDPSEAIADIAAGRRDIFLRARAVNDRKARATTATFACAGLGFGFLVLGLLVTAVGSVV